MKELPAIKVEVLNAVPQHQFVEKLRCKILNARERAVDEIHETREPANVEDRTGKEDDVEAEEDEEDDVEAEKDAVEDEEDKAKDGEQKAEK